MSWWSHKRKYESATERTWIKYFEDSGKLWAVPDDVDPDLGTILASLKDDNRKKVAKEVIYDASDDMVNNQTYLVTLFGMADPLSELQIRLISFASANAAILRQKNKISAIVVKPVMQILLQFFFQMCPDATGGCLDGHRVVGFSPAFAQFVTVALSLQRDLADDIAPLLSDFFRGLVVSDAQFETETVMREFTLAVANACLQCLACTPPGSDAKVDVMSFVIRYVNVSAAHMSEIQLTPRELECMMSSIEVLATKILTLPKKECPIFAKQLVDVILTLHSAFALCGALKYEINDLYSLGMKGLEKLMVLGNPGLPQPIDLKEHALLPAVFAFAIWCIDRIGFERVPKAQTQFTKEIARDKSRNGFEFVKCRIQFNASGQEEWKFRKYDISGLYETVQVVLTAVIDIFKFVGSLEMCSDVVRRFLSICNSSNASAFKNRMMVPFYAAFVMSYVMLNIHVEEELTSLLEPLFEPYFFDISTNVDLDHHKERVLCRNFMFQILAREFDSDLKGMAAKLLGMFDAPVCVCLELVTFFCELLRLYNGSFIRQITLDHVFRLDRALQEIEMPGREVIFMFLDELIKRKEGVELLLSQNSYILRLMDCSFDQRLINRALDLLTKSLTTQHKLGDFVRFFAHAERLLTQAIEETKIGWVKYLISVLPFFDGIMRCFRHFYGSSTEKLETLIRALIGLTMKMAKSEEFTVLSPLLQVFRTLITGDAWYRRACAELYELCLFVDDVNLTVVDDMLTLVYESVVCAHSCVKNAAALRLVHSSLVHLPETHERVFTRIFNDVKTSIPNQLVLFRSDFINDIAQFMNDQPKHTSYGVFAEGMAHLLSNFFDMRFMSKILKFGLSENWESVILRASEIPVHKNASKPFVYLSDSEAKVELSSKKEPFERVDIEFMLPYMPDTSHGRLMCISDGEGNLCDIFVGMDGVVRIVLRDKGNRKLMRMTTDITLEVNIDYKCSLSFSSKKVTLHFADLNYRKVGFDLLTRVVWRTVGLGFSLEDQNSRLALIVYDVVVRGRNSVLFVADFSHLIGTEVVNKLTNRDIVICSVTGLNYPRRTTVSDPLLVNGGMFDLINECTESHTLVFMAKLLKNLVNNEPAFEPRFFTVAMDTCFGTFGALMDQSKITDEFVSELRELTNSTKDEKYQFAILNTWWFDFGVWRDSSVFDYVWESVLPEIMNSFSEFVSRELTIRSLLCWGCDVSSFWHATCCYLLQTEKCDDFIELRSYVELKLPIYFFLELFGVCHRRNDTYKLIQKLSPEDLTYYFEQCFFLMVKEDTEKVVTEAVFDGLASDLITGKAMAIMFDVLMLISPNVPAQYLVCLLRSVCDSASDELILQILDSQLLNIWMAHMVLNQDNSSIDLAHCDQSVIDFLVTALIRGPHRFTEFITLLRQISCPISFSSSIILRHVFMSACEVMQNNEKYRVVEIVAIIVEYIFFVPSSGRFGLNIGLNAMLGGKMRRISRCLIRPVPLFDIVETAKRAISTSSFELVMRCRISEDGQWEDRALASALVGVIFTPQLRNSEIQFTDHQSLVLEHICGHIIQWLLVTESSSLTDITKCVMTAYASDFDVIRDLTVRLITFGAFRRFVRGHDPGDAFDEFVVQFRSHLESDGKVARLGETSEMMFKRVIGSSYAESNLMWHRLLDNFGAVAQLKLRQHPDDIGRRFPFTVFSPKVREFEPFDHLSRWRRIFTISNLLESRKLQNTSGCVIVDNEFAPIATDGANIKFVSVENVITTKKNGIVPVTIRSGGNVVKSFIACGPNEIVVGGMVIFVRYIRWVVQHSALQVELFMYCGDFMLLEFEDTTGRDVLYEFVKTSRLMNVSSVSVCSQILWLNFMNGRSYNLGNILIPRFSDADIVTSSEIGHAWNFVRRFIETTDVTGWIRENLTDSPIHANTPKSIAIDGHSRVLKRAMFVASHSNKVLAVIPDSDSCVTCHVIGPGPKFSTIDRFPLRVVASSQARFVFWSDSVFMFYCPSQRALHTFEKPAGFGDAKLISSIELMAPLRDIQKIDSERVVVVLVNDCIQIVKYCSSTVSVFRIYVKQNLIVTCAVNIDLNLLATFDSRGTVVLTSLSTYFYVKTINLDLGASRLTCAQLLRYGAIVIETSESVQVFWLDGSRHGRIGYEEKMLRVVGVLGNVEQLIALHDGETDIRFVNPFNPFPPGIASLSHPILQVTCCGNSCYACDGQSLLHVTFK